MPSIKILEQDLTTVSVDPANANIVYVPGFADQGPVGEPLLCTSVDDFIEKFGEQPHFFKETQYYPNMLSAAKPAQRDSVTGEAIIYDAGDFDLSYLYAKELLAAGLPVLYERVIDTPDTQETVTVKDADGNDRIYEVYFVPVNEAKKNGLTYRRIIKCYKDTSANLYVPCGEDEKYPIKFSVDGTYASKSIYTGGFEVKAFYDQLAKFSIDNIRNKGEYDVKFITTGAYPTFEITAEYSNEIESDINGQIKLTTNHTKLDKAAGIQIDFGEDSEVIIKDVTYNVISPEGTLMYTHKSLDTMNTSAACAYSVYAVDYSEDSVEIETYDPEHPSEPVKFHVKGDSGVPTELYKLKNTDAVTGIVIILNQDILSGNDDLGDYSCYVSYKTTKNVISNLAQDLLRVSSDRGDTIALVDHTNREDRPLTGVESVYYSASILNALNYGEYGAMFTPWCNFSCGQVTWSSELDYELPASFAYLICLANSIKTNANWIAVAGSTRGRIPNLSLNNPMCPNEILTNTIAEYYQPDDMVAINPITNIKPYGYTIWGNRTLKKNNVAGGVTATSFLNLRNLVCDVKKEIFVSCKKLMFEQNSDILWINFQASITPILDKMKTGYGISNYKIIKDPTNDRSKLKARVVLYPIYAVEKFDITVVLTDDEVTVE